MDSGTLFGCLLDMVEAPKLKCTCNPSAAAGGMDKVCRAPFQTTLSVKTFVLRKRLKNNNKKSATRHLWQPKLARESMQNIRWSQALTMTHGPQGVACVSCDFLSLGLILANLGRHAPPAQADLSRVQLFPEGFRLEALACRMYQDTS